MPTNAQASIQAPFLDIQEPSAESTCTSARTKEQIYKTISLVAALGVGFNFALIGDNTGKIVTTNKMLQYYFIASSTSANVLETGLTTQTALQTLFSPSATKNPIALNITAGIISIAIMVTNVLLGITGRNDRLITYAAVASSAFSIFSGFFGASKLLSGCYQQYVNRFHHSTTSQNEDPLLLNAIAENTLKTRSKSGYVIDAFLILLMLFAVSGYVVKTQSDLYQSGSDKIPPILARICACLLAVFTGLGLAGLSTNAALGMRQTAAGVLNSIYEKDRIAMSAAFLTVLLTACSGSSAFLANYETWKPLGKSYAIPAGYVAFCACTLVNIVYGFQTIQGLLDSAFKCRESELENEETDYVSNPTPQS